MSVYFLDSLDCDNISGTSGSPSCMFFMKFI